ncbi:28S ribosomal protein S17, mitochondrial [Orussus abietinus]|uniref:28S ribosomal protein S17, mitochondrial n=1 Tax=Orussus abietinus TaxID=222816 RepID=UPI0006255279|nr:28S ribosomal protein S17, mitochondrial [Orussus abietinus]
MAARAAAEIAAKGRQVLRFSLGQCMPCGKPDAVKIRIRQSELDQNLLMYFDKDEFVYAHDPLRLCKTGDTVLIQSLPQKLTRLITHKVVEVVYPLGDVTDPITNKKVVRQFDRDSIKKYRDLHGENPTAFDYEKAPPRGHLEDKRDFTHQESYVKYHEDPNDPQPYAI